MSETRGSLQMYGDYTVTRPQLDVFVEFAVAAILNQADRSCRRVFSDYSLRKFNRFHLVVNEAFQRVYSCN